MKLFLLLWGCYSIIRSAKCFFIKHNIMKLKKDLLDVNLRNVIINNNKNSVLTLTTLIMVVETFIDMFGFIISTYVFNFDLSNNFTIVFTCMLLFTFKFFDFNIKLLKTKKMFIRSNKIFTETRKAMLYNVKNDCKRYIYNYTTCYISIYSSIFLLSN